MNLKYLINKVNKHFGCDIKKNSRKRKLVMSRGAYFWLARHTTNNSLQKIGDSVGRDHASVSYSLANFNDWLRFDEFFKADFESLKVSVLSRFKTKKMPPQTLLYKYNNMLIENEILKNEIKKLKK
tara:strand:- start:1152 stop:1529 length:378 start_codon:yes stop_codon:yes gene_type:complete